MKLIYNDCMNMEHSQEGAPSLGTPGSLFQRHSELRISIETGTDISRKTFEEFTRTGVAANLNRLNIIDPIQYPHSPFITAAADNLAVFIRIRADTTGKEAIGYCNTQMSLLSDQYTSLRGIAQISEEEMERQAELPLEDQSPGMQPITQLRVKFNNWKKMRGVLLKEYLYDL